MLTLTGLVLLGASAGGIGWFSPLSWDELFGVQAFGLLRVVSPTQVLPPLPLPPLQIAIPFETLLRGLCIPVDTNLVILRSACSWSIVMSILLTDFDPVAILKSCTALTSAKRGLSVPPTFAHTIYLRKT